ncbi:MAG TPA: hypothetical protein VL002_05795, partial [Candidimonas sp.]|nr:hypothetical protein [Candidimonas sp.]
MRSTCPCSSPCGAEHAWPGSSSPFGLTFACVTIDQTRYDGQYDQASDCTAMAQTRHNARHHILRPVTIHIATSEIQRPLLIPGPMSERPG